MNNISPDFQIVTFKIFGVNYLYQGSSGSVFIISGKEVLPIKAEIEDALKGAVTQHIPASVQIINALIASGYGESLPVITYTKDQPQDTLPEGAIS
jgi:hypothetical protein